jgi:uncharacterized protein Smg (DUF494 family)
VTVVVIVVAVLLVAVVLVVVVRRRRRPTDGVELFQRQIDALSPEARRPVIDRVQALEDDEERGRRGA